MYIVRPDIEETDFEKLVDGFNAVVTNGGGEVKSTEKMGRRRLAYVVRKFQDGQFVLLTIAADGKLVAELERRLRVTEQVIKFITVRTDEENKRLAKIKAHRDSRKKVSAEHAPAAPVAAATVTESTPEAAPEVATVQTEEAAPVPVQAEETAVTA